jgi:hypothetical protein
MTNDDETTTPMPMPRTDRRRPARFGTVLWGVLLLVFAATMTVSRLPGVHIDPTTLALTACIAAGVLLVAAGVATTVVRSRAVDRSSDLP